MLEIKPSNFVMGPFYLSRDEAKALFRDFFTINS